MIGAVLWLEGKSTSYQNTIFYITYIWGWQTFGDIGIIRLEEGGVILFNLIAWAKTQRLFESTHQIPGTPRFYFALPVFFQDRYYMHHTTYMYMYI